MRFTDVSDQSYDRGALEKTEQDRWEALEASLRAEKLENVRLAAQRAQEAVMLARSMQADIRSGNAKLQRSAGQGVRNEGTPQTYTQSSATQSAENHGVPLLLDALKNHEIMVTMAVPMAWISNVLRINK